MNLLLECDELVRLLDSVDFLEQGQSEDLALALLVAPALPVLGECSIHVPSTRRIPQTGLDVHPFFEREGNQKK